MRSQWLLTLSEGPVKGSGATKYGYEPVEVAGGRMVIEPEGVLAAAPSDVSCGTKAEEVKKGCRALLFTYATSTSAKGETPSEWGEYTGRLKTVSFKAYNPASKEMEKPIPVAEYSYDTEGRLRAQWDPRIKPELKTTYGYDAEGHVTAMTPPGEETWAFSYGTTANEPNTGRLLKVTRAPAAARLWNGEAPQDTAAPKLSGSAIVGSTMNASTRTWGKEPGGKEPVASRYQWQRCSAAGTECALIPGASNQTYTPIVPDAGHALRAQITATNGGGSVTAMTEATGAVAGAAPAFLATIGSSGTGADEFEDPTAVALAPNGDVWVADGSNNRVQEFNANREFIEAIGWGVSNGKEEFQTCTSSCRAGLSGDGEGELSDPEGIAVNQTNSRVYVADANDDRIQEFSPTGSFVTAFGGYGTEPGKLNHPHGLTIDSSGDVWVADSENCRVEEFSSSGAFLTTFGQYGKKPGQFEGTFGVAFAGANLYVTDIENQRVQEFNAKDEWVREFGNSGSESEKLDFPWAIATDAVTGNIYVTSYGTARVEAFTQEGKYVEGFGHFGSEPEELEGPSGLAISATTGAIYIADESNNRVDVWAPGGVSQEPTQPAPTGLTGSVATIDYNVPVSGSGAPYALGAKETEAWGQKDDPVQAVAIFPPDKPMGWPAASYARATITYMDGLGRTVNTANPSGGISTTEYNETNEPVRTLSPDNRATALAEGGGSVEKSAAFSKEIDSETVYNEKGQIAETLGPEHEVRLAKGKKANEEAQARAHAIYSYDEESPGGTVFNLVTKIVSGAETTNKEEFDKRTTKTSYSGQKGLGWTLRKPTSTTVDSGGLSLTTTTEYEEATGNVIKTVTPGRGNSGLPLGFSQFGKAGSGAGQVNDPTAATLDSSGDLWVADTGNNRVDEFTATGMFIQAFGWGVNKGESKLEVCTNTCKAGLAGSGEGQLSEPQGVVSDEATGDIYVSDTGNNRIVEFTTKGKLKNAYGAKGTGNLQFDAPQGLTAESAGDIWVADRANHRLEEITDKGKYVKEAGVGKGEYADVTLCGGKLFAADYAGQRVEEVGTEGKETILKTFGAAGKESGQFTQISRIACDPKNSELYVTDQGGDRVDAFSDAGQFIGAMGAAGSGNGQLATPVGVTVNSAGTAYVVDNANNRLTEWALNEGAHDTTTAYYTAEGESEVPACRNHPEWADLPCQTAPTEQPGTAGLPELPVTTVTYNLWDEVEATTERFGAVTRSKAQTYDAAGRAWTSHTTSTSAEDSALPEVTDEYSTKNGELERQSSEGKTITSIYNMIGQLTTYTDADGNMTTHEYEPEGDTRLIETNDGKGTQTYTYNASTGYLTKLVDSAAGTFTASYDLEGKLATDAYPNGMTASYTYNHEGTATDIEYVKSAHCATKCPEVWFSDAIVPSIHGETLAQTSTLSKENYVYDDIGRLVETQETPKGKGCKTRLYGYDEESNRISLTPRETSGETCAAEGGVTEAHSYDSANRLVDACVSYDAFGDTTKLPEADAGGHELTLTTSYYVDGQVAAQTQSGETVKHYYDPAGRSRESVSTGKTSGAAIMHYSGSAEAVAWTGEGGGKWTRNIPGIDGALDATETSAGITILQVHDLKGDIVGMAEDSEAKTELLSTYNSTEFGVPNEGKVPPKYAWFGANGIATELSGGITSQGGASYIPQIAKDLQTAPIVPPGQFPDGAGSGSPYTSTISAAEITSSEAESRQYVEEVEAARQKAKIEEEEARGEEEFGDPMRCYVGGNAAEYKDKAGLDGYGGCNQGLPAGTWLYVCLGLESDALPGDTYAQCSHVEVKGHTSVHWAIGDSKAAHCAEGEIAKTLVEFYVPGGKVLYAASENAGECTGDSDAEDEAALSLFGTDDSLGAVQGVLEFFQASME